MVGAGLHSLAPDMDPNTDPDPDMEAYTDPVTDPDPDTVTESDTDLDTDLYPDTDLDTVLYLDQYPVLYQDPYLGPVMDPKKDLERGS
jgi:hypothetical protein